MTHTLTFRIYGERAHSKAKLVKRDDTPIRSMEIDSEIAHSPWQGAEAITAHFGRHAVDAHYRAIDVASYGQAGARETFGLDRTGVYGMSMRQPGKRRIVSVVFWMDPQPDQDAQSATATVDSSDAPIVAPEPAQPASQASGALRPVPRVDARRAHTEARMDTKHTPGPWLVTPMRSRVSVSSTTLGAPYAYEVPIAYLADDPLTHEAAEANARLIAAAPELVDALRSITECAAAGPDGANMDLWIDQARALLARIERE